MTKLMAFVSATIVGLALAARPAAAQTASGSQFIGVAVGGALGDSTMPGMVPTMGGSFGVMGERHGVQIEFAATGSHEQNSGPFRYQFTFPDARYYRLGHFYEDSEHTNVRSVIGTVLYAHPIQSSGRVQARWLAGGGMAPSFSQRTFVTKEVQPDGSLVVVNTDHFPGGARHLVAAIGVDADVRMSRRLSIVPSVRVIFFPIDMFDDAVDHSGSGEKFLFAPQVAVRWRF